MLSFPIPYEEELIYSTIARAKVHEGDTSPKQVLDLIFGDRKIIASVSLPSHFKLISQHYPASLSLNAIKLIRGHSLWPIYASFHSAQLNKKLFNWMYGESKGAAHLALGMAASRVKSKTKLHVCPECIDEQKAIHGEGYWKRAWQVPKVQCCEKHGALFVTNIGLNGDHRHEYIPVDDSEILYPLEASSSDNVFAEQVAALLRASTQVNTELDQWTLFYQRLAREFGFIKGNRPDHDSIKTRFQVISAIF